MSTYTDPQSVLNPTAGQPLSAAWCDTVRDDLEWLARNKPHCRVYNSGNLATVTSTLTTLTFDSERVDVGGMHSTVSNTARLTIPSGGDGWYDIGGCIRWQANATGARTLRVLLNGATTIVSNDIQAAASDSHELPVSTKYQLVAGDILQLIAYQASGGALNVLAQGNYSPEFWATWECI